MSPDHKELLRIKIIRKLVEKYLQEPESDPDETLIVIEEVLTDPNVDLHSECYYDFPIVDPDAIDVVM